jgi:hypothetical protein
MWLLIGLLALTVLLPFVILGHFVYAARNTRLEISYDEVRVSGNMFYSRSIPRPAIRSEGVRAVDLEREPALRPRWRTNGVAIPGYQSGWFKLRNGERALLFVRDKRRVVYVPTSEGYSLLVSVDEPERVAAQLRQSGGGRGEDS